MPTINISGSSGVGPGQGKSASPGYDYLKAQFEAQKKASSALEERMKAEREAAKVTKDAAKEAAKLQMEAGRIALRTAKEVERLSLKTARDASNLAKQTAVVERKNYDTMRKRADEENRDYNQRKRFRERQEAAVRRNDPNTYRAENVSRLGVMGMRAAERNDWRGLHRSERELGQIQRRFGHHPGVAAALAQARGRISAGGEGNPGWMMSLGRMSGAFSEMGALEGSGFLLGGPAGAGVAAGAYAAFKTGKAILDAPMTISNYAQGMLGVAQPYMGLRSQLSAMGRASDSYRPGTLNSMNLENAFRPTGANGNWLQKYGLSRGSASQLLGQFGIVPNSVMEGTSAVHSIARTAYNTGMDPALIASMAGSANNLGIADKGDFNSNGSIDEYLKKVQRITATAVSQGMNQSQATNILDGLYKQSTTANTATLGNGSGVADLWTRMMQAGTPSARSGASTASVIAGAQSFSNDISFDTQNPARAQVMASYIQRHGGPKAFGAGGNELQNLIGAERYKMLSTTPGGQETLRRINEAAASGNAGLLMNTLAPVVGDPDTVQRAIEGSFIHDKKGPWGDLARERAGGASAQATNDRNATQGYNLDAGTAAGDDSTTGRARRLYTILRKQGWDAYASADMVANALTEAPGLDPHAHNELGGGHHGLFQLGTARQKLFLEHMGFAITDPRATMEKQAEFNDWELHNSEKTAGNFLKKGPYIPGYSAFSRFDERPGNGEVEAHNRGALGDRIGPQLEASYQSVKSNSNADVNRINSQTGELATGAAQTEFERINAGAKVLGDMLVNVSSGAEKLNAAFFQLATTVGTLNGSLSRGGGSSTGMPGPYDSRTLGKG